MIITWPNLKVSSFRWRFVENQIVHAGPFGSQGLATGVPVLEAELSGVPAYWQEAEAIQSFLESLKGYQNQLELYNMTRQVPLGTMRGTLTLKNAVAQGDSTFVISGGVDQAGKTLLKDDWIGMGAGTTQQVFKVVEDATADTAGDIAVTVTTPSRNAFAAGVSVTWNKPKALFRQKSLNEGIEFVPVVGQPWALSLREDWRA